MLTRLFVLQQSSSLFHALVTLWVLLNPQGQLTNFCLLRDIFEDIIGSLLETSPDEDIFISQPCRDNILYLLKLSDELLVDQIGIKLLVSSEQHVL